MCVAAAIAGAGLAGAAGTAAAGKSAAGAAENASNNANAMTQLGLATEQQDTSKFRTAGQAATNSIMSLLGMGQYGALGGGNNSQIESLLSSLPGYQFNLDQGERGIANAAAGSTGISSASLTGMNNYAQGQAQQAFGTELGGLQNLAGLGENAAVGTGYADASILNTGTNAETSSITNAGNANAAGILGSTSSITNGLINGLTYGQNQQGGGISPFNQGMNYLTQNSGGMGNTASNPGGNGTTFDNFGGQISSLPVS